MTGKGSKPRPFSVDQKTFEDNWNKIFQRTKEHYEDYQDILTTEECVLDALENRKEFDNENNIRKRNI